VNAAEDRCPQHFVELEALAECNACSSRAITPRYADDLWACAECGVLFRNPRPSFREIVRSYDSGITYAAWQREDGVRAMLWAKRLGILLRYKRAGALLDVGTGDGRFLDFACAHFEITSTEVSESGARHARARGHAPLIGPVLGTVLPAGHFEVITLWHVLEHLLYPGQALQALRRALRPGGILAIAVPNETAPLVVGRLPGRAARHPLGRLAWGQEIHLTHFVPSTLRGLLRRQGFRILEMGVDDVHVERSPARVASYHANRLLNALVGLQFDKAMYVVCTPFDDRDAPNR
jgi:SAM-dependent methyltransferase